MQIRLMPKSSPQQENISIVQDKNIENERKKRIKYFKIQHIHIRHNGNSQLCTTIAFFSCYGR